ncbi:MAG: DUF4190 domain-containing protein [Pirellulaceae bacterium]|nr:DUF4190 domain-containing protein [Pirellulaceae bacterium]
MFTPENGGSDPWFETVAAKGKSPYDPDSPFVVAGPRIVSSLAIISVIFALVSPVVLCVCGLSLLTSLIAIVTGHVALVRIKNSLGQLTGRGMALFGLIVGYLMFGISIAALIVFVPAFQNGWRKGQQESAQEDRAATFDASKRLRDAEMDVLTDTDGLATGNSQAALELATDYSKLMKKMRDVVFTKGSDGSSALTKGEFVTHCEFHEDRCAFIVHVPEYRNFDDEAKDSLATIAWTVAQGVVEEKLQPGDQLAVGLRGTVLYGAVLVGMVAAVDEEEAEFEQRERDDLLSFFLPTLAERTRTPMVPRPTVQPPRQTTVKSPDTARRSVPKSKPTLMDGVPKSRDVVQEFPKMGWAVESLSFAPHGRWLAAGKLDRTLLILDVETGATLCAKEKLAELSSIKQVAFSPDGGLVAAAGSSGAVFTWSIDSAGVLADAKPLNRHGQPVQCLALSPTAPLLMTGSSSGELLWQSYMGASASTGEDSTPHTFKALPRGALAFYLPKTNLEALATDGSTLVRVDLETSKVIAIRRFPGGGAQAAAFSSDGNKLAVTDGYKIQVWDTATGISLGTLDGDHEMQWSVAFLPDGNRLISGGRGFATLWDLEQGKAECRFDLGGILYIQTFAISPDASLLAAIPASAGQTLTVLRIPQ